MSTQKENSPSVENSGRAVRIRLEIQGLDEARQGLREIRDLLREIRELHNEIFNCNSEMCDTDQVGEKISQAVLNASKRGDNP